MKSSRSAEAQLHDFYDNYLKICVLLSFTMDLKTLIYIYNHFLLVLKVSMSNSSVTSEYDKWHQSV
jgi:hypothetical protein